MNELGPLTMKDPATNALVTIDTHTLLTYPDGFSFGVRSELDAYRAAYLYRYSKTTRVTSNHNGWRVSVWQ